MEKTCCKCKTIKPIIDFGRLTNSPDGLRYDCKHCRKQYVQAHSELIKMKQKKYYEEHKPELLVKNRQYRSDHINEISEQRKEYRARPEIKQHVKEKNNEYLETKKSNIKIRRKTDLNFRMSEILRSKIHKMIKNIPTSYQNIIGCDIGFFNKWIEFRFDEKMSWSNLGTYWQIDHILPINAFDFTSKSDKCVCFHWTNLQPLQSTVNKSKSDKIQLHYYFNNIVNIHRFNSKYNQFLGYQAVNESLQWLRRTLRYGKNAPYEDLIKSEIGNQQRSSYVRYNKDKENVQRVDGSGLDGIN